MSDPPHLPASVAKMMAEDRASASMGMSVDEAGEGRAVVRMRIGPEMVNGHAIAHGGLVFALADSAFAFACNTYNESTVAAAAAIDFLAAARAGDELTAEASELWRTKRNGIYEISISNQRGERVALFRGRSYRIAGQVTAMEE